MGPRLPLGPTVNGSTSLWREANHTWNCPTRRRNQMASRTIVLLEDDVDGSKADETIEFGIDGTTYAIDLSNSNATKLRGALDGYISKARKMRGKRSTSRKASSTVDVKAVRAWAA